MSKTVQWKRGNTAVNSTYTGAQGEITVDTTDWSLYVHDGLTPGGYKISNDTDINVNIGNLVIADQTISGINSNQDIIIDPLGTGNTSILGNLVVSANITGQYFVGNGALLTGITDSIGATGPVGATGFTGATGVTGLGTNYSNANVVAYSESGWAGNIKPSANAVYSLGGPNLQWANLWVANNTIYFGNIAVGLDGNNVLTVNSEQVLTNNAETPINLAANFTAGNINAYRTTSTYFIGDGSQLTGLPAGVNIGYITFDKDTIQGTDDYQYTFATDGYFSGSTNSESPNYFFIVSNVVNQNVAVGWTVVGTNCDTTVDGTLYPVPGYPGVIQINLATPATSTIGFYPVVVASPDRLQVQIQPDPTSNVKYTFTTGNVNFPDGKRMKLGSANTWIGWNDADTNYLELRSGTPASNVSYSVTDQHSNYWEAFTEVDRDSESSTWAWIQTGWFDGNTQQPQVFIETFRDNNGSRWTFDHTGNLSLPGGGTIFGNPYTPSGAPGNTITLQPAVSGAITDQKLLIYPTAGDGDHIHLTSGNLYQTELFLGSDNLYVKLSSTGDVVVNPNDGTGNTAQWIFDPTGNLTAPGYITADTFVSTSYNVLTAGNLLITSQYGLGVTGTILEDGGTLELIGNNTGCVVVGWNSIYGSASPVAQMYFNPVGSSGNAVLTTGNTAGTSYDWTFDDQGNLTLPTGGKLRVSGEILAYPSASPAPSISGFSTADFAGNVTAAYFLGNGSLLTGITAASNYGNSNVSTLLASFGSNVISTTGNVTAQNFIGNISITGNVTGTSANVQLVAGTYTWTFDNTGNTSFANGTATISNLTLTGNLTGNTNGFAIGYRDIPQISFSANATTALADAGKHYYSTSSSNLVLTVANNATVAFSIGSTMNIINQGTANITISRAGGVTMYLAGNSTSSDRTLSTYGVATLTKVATDTWFVVGAGLS